MLLQDKVVVVAKAHTLDRASGRSSGAFPWLRTNPGQVPVVWQENAVRTMQKSLPTAPLNRSVAQGNLLPCGTRTPFHSALSPALHPNGK